MPKSKDRLPEKLPVAYVTRSHVPPELSLASRRCEAPSYWRTKMCGVPLLSKAKSCVPPSSAVPDSQLLDGRSVSGELKPGDDAAEVGYFGRDDLPPMAFSVHKKVIMSVI